MPGWLDLGWFIFSRQGAKDAKRAKEEQDD
jgi:hypothetical protein